MKRVFCLVPCLHIGPGKQLVQHFVIKNASTHGVDIKQLIAVNKLIDEVRGMEQMRFAMQALEQLQ